MTSKIASAAWNTSDPAKNLPSGGVQLSKAGFSAMEAISLNLRTLAERLGYHTYILDTRLTQRVHYRSPTAEGNRFIAAHVNSLMLQVVRLRNYLLAEIVDVNRFVIQIDALRAVDSDDHAHFRQFFHRFRFWDVHVDARLQNRRGDHEDNQQHQYDADKRHHIDFLKCSPGLALNLRHGGFLRAV